eukprot:gene15280-6491_t
MFHGTNNSGTTLVLGNEIVYPFAVNNGAERRELFTGKSQSGAPHADEVVFQLDRKDGPMILEMKRNAGFHAKKIVMRTFEDDGTPKIEKHSPDGCYYNGKVAYKDDSNVLLDTCDGLRGTIEDEGKVFSIEPLENVKVTGAHVIREVVPEKDDLSKRMLGINPFNNDFVEVENDESYDTVSATMDKASDEQIVSKLVPDVDPVYAKYPATNKTRYCEMVLVIDNAIYVKYNRSKEMVLSRMLRMMQAADRVFAAINVRLVLVGIEIWTDKNKIPYHVSGGGQLTLFRDVKGWEGYVVGTAYVGDICGSLPATAVNKWVFHTLTGTHDVVTHELGHNFGFGHDAPACKCLTSRGCMMGGPETRRVGFSDCNMKIFSSRSYHCLNNYPFGSLDNVCGNGIIEGSEECDCGSPEMCKKHDKCCEPNGCKLKRSAQCSDFSTPDCCDNCLFKLQGTLCRRSQKDCDLPEYCPGNAATCPNDLYKTDGFQCIDGVSKTMSYCYKGNCMESRSTQCKNLWDPATNSAHDSCWQKLNTEAQGFGTCDPSTNKSCAAQDIFCGQLQCSSPNLLPSNEKYGTVYKQFNLNGSVCSAASITIPGSASNDEVGEGMVAEGTKCGDNKMCSNYKCKSFSELNITSCGLVNGVSCAGRGICNNKGRCHCNGGYDPKTNCEKVLTPDDGNWGQWNQWSLCSAACAGGRRSRSRFCDSPFPAHGGKTCPGVGYEEAVCNSEQCPKAGSCKLLMGKFKASGKQMVDGVYDITLPDGSLMKMYCDMTRDGGGWTLVVSSHTNDWTTSEMVRERNKDQPNMYKDYSILKYVDQIKDNYKIDDKNFEYRLEAHRRGQWGGIWSAPTSYRLNGMSPSQTNVILLKRFNNWSYSGIGIAQRMPYIIGNRLTMQTNQWGSITGNMTWYHPAPWIDGHLMERKPEHIWYWIREGKHSIPTSCMKIKLRSLTHGNKAKSGLYEIQNLEGKKVLSTFCDMESFGGGWTLVLNKVSTAGWTKESTLSRNTDKASKDNDYSILFHSHEVINLRKEETKFQYMIEADGVKKWGGVFEGHNSDGLIACTPSKFKPRLIEKFDNWDEQKSNLMSSNPYVVDNPASYLTTSRKIYPGTDGVLVSETDSNFIKGSMEKPRFVRLWIREGSSQGSCNQIKLGGERNGAVYKSGYYTIEATGANILTVYCDMESGPGAWTLLVTSTSNKWTASQVLSRNEDFPSTSNDYSILHVADSIKDLSNNATFKYKLEAHTFNHWGGIWAAPKEYTFVSKSNNQNKVTLLTQFDDLQSSVKNRMPWLGNGNGLLTTAEYSSSYWWGTIVASNDEYRPAPWIYPIMRNPGTIWYWVNEDDCDPDRMPVDGSLTKWSSWTQCTSFCSQGTQERSRSCTALKPRCGGAVCDPNKARREIRNCTGKCLSSPIRSFDENHCVLPETGGCSPDDSTELIWKSGSEKCDLPEAQFIFDPSHGSFVHKCSGKSVCPKGDVLHATRLQINSNCPKMALKKRFTRTQFGSIHFDHACIHPMKAMPEDNMKLHFWSGCHGDRLKLSLYKIEHGPVHADVWFNLNFVNLRMTDFTSDTRFPSNPTTSGYLDNFDSPYSLGSNYGLRLWSYFAAPESGMYTFYAACDDFCQIFLSPTVYEKDKKKIIDVQGWTSPYQYDKRSSQKSIKIQLEAGKLYYLEGLLLEMSGGDHLSVAVDLPSGKKLIPLSYYYLRAKAES